MKESTVILIVEDNEDYAAGLKRTIERAIDDVTIFVKKRDFAHALDDLPLLPDVFIIDLYEDEYTSDAKPTGPELCQQIWKKRFRPIIVHSAFDVDPHIEHRLALHPFYKYIRKGHEKSLDDVATQVKGFLADAVELRKIEDEVHAVLQTVIQDTAETIWNTQKDPKARSNALMRSARRRVGAMMDLKPMLTEETVQPWEQYIVPPLDSEHLLMADILLAEDANPEDPSAYRVVLTPSCDLVLRKGKAKVKAVLVGRCVNAKTFFDAVKLNPADNAAALKKPLATILTQAQVNGYSALPAYPGLWPEMAIKLRDTEFLSFDAISSHEKKAQFKRVASIDSPFREQIAWAHMQIGSRPALPDRDIEAWVDGLITAAKQ